MPFQPIDPIEPIAIHRGKLPHWRQRRATYFVTARLADSIPAIVMEDWRFKRDAWLRTHKVSGSAGLENLSEEQRHEYHREFTQRFHELLDAGHGECALARKECAEFLQVRLALGHSVYYDLDAWVIMPNHFHALVQPNESTTLGKVVQSWKGGSAREINLALDRSGQLWQRESFDHIVRSEMQLNRFRQYIALNPEKAHLRKGFVVGVGAESGISADEVLGRFGLPRDPK